MVREKINRLDEKDREIIIMRYYQDLKYEEIAELLDIPLSSVKIRLYRAKQALKAILEGIPDEVR
jgi:RNA polymerase sigma-70 factor (ECF subfamily)